MPPFRLLVLLAASPFTAMAAQQPAPRPSTTATRRPTARRASPAPQRDTTAQRFTVIRQRYQKELDNERAALQRTRDHMREDLVAAGWRPQRMMRSQHFSARFARMRQPGGRRGMRGQRGRPRFSGRGMTSRRPPIAMPGGRGMAMGGRGMMGRGGRPGMMGPRGPMNRTRPDSARAMPRDTTGGGQ